MKLVTDKGETIIEAESNLHAVLQLLIFFECNDFKINFTDKTFSIMEYGGKIIDG